MQKHAARALRASEFVGRTGELEALSAALQRALKFNAPQLVSVFGALGMGKTRLVRRWLSLQGAVGVRVVRAAAAEAASAHRGSGTLERFGLLAALLRDRFLLDRVADQTAALVEFRRELQDVFRDRRVAEVAGLLGHYLGFELPESPLSQALASKPEQGRDLARAVLCRFLEQDARARPLVLVLEDLQAADDASLEILQELSAELGEAPIVVIATARPDFLVRRPSWSRAEGSHVRLELGPLPRRDLDVMVRSMLGAEELAPGLVERAAVESGGNPFLLEQLLRVYHQHGILAAETGQGWTFDLERAERESMAVTPEEAAQTRVAALGPAERELLGRAAAFGERFWTGGVVSLGRLGLDPSNEMVFAPDPAIQEIRLMLENLEEREYVGRVGESSIPGEVEWVFRSSLEQLLIAALVEPGQMRRRKGFAAQWLESRGGSSREGRFECLGQLYADAGDARRAAYCFISAADHARAHVLLDRARTLYLEGTRLLEAEDAVAKMDALHRLGDVTARLGRTREALAHFHEMLRISWRLDLPSKGGAAHNRLGRLNGTLGEQRKALEHLEMARQLFQVAGDLPGLASTLDDIGRLQLVSGALEASLEYHRAALKVREGLGDDRGRAMTLSRMGQVEREIGQLAAAGEHLRQALDLRRRAGDRQGQAWSLLDLGMLERELGNTERAVAILQDGRTLARDIGERLFECSFSIAIGECRLAQARPRDALAELKEAQAIARQFGAKALVCEATRAIAEALVALGETGLAHHEARAAFELAGKIGSTPLAGAALRVMAAAVGLGAPGDAELGGAREMFDRAIELLSNAGAELELGRTLAAYAELEERSGRDETAAELRRQALLIRDKARRAAPATIEITA